MHAAELMVGDWILCQGDPVQILGINGELNTAYICKAEPGYEIILDDKEPLPLTVEILEKNDFYCHHGYLYSLQKDGVDVCISAMNMMANASREKDFMEVNNIELKYVHQLQHLLRLIGYEEEVVV